MRLDVQSTRVGLPWLEQGTSVLSGLRSNQLSYRPGRPAAVTLCDNWRVSNSERAVCEGIDLGGLGCGSVGRQRVLDRSSVRCVCRLPRTQHNP